jgi:hypothetical protein
LKTKIDFTDLFAALRPPAAKNGGDHDGHDNDNDHCDGGDVTMSKPEAVTPVTSVWEDAVAKTGAEGADAIGEHPEAVAQSHQADEEPVDGQLRNDEGPPLHDRIPTSPRCQGRPIPDSRTPIILTDLRDKIEAIEPAARVLGWPPELLWNNRFWGLPRGLAAVLDIDDEITAFTDTYIEIRKRGRDVRRFYRYSA